MPGTWISLFLTRSAGSHCPGRDHVTEISLGFTVDRKLILEELRDTCVDTRVEKPTLQFL